MLWEHIRSGMIDELSKIASVDLSGLSPQTVLERSAPPPPMETAGFSKAREILGRAELNKTASRIPGSAVGLPQVRRLQDEDKKDPSVAGQAKSLAGHTLAGAGAGRLAGFAAHGPKLGVSNAAKQSLHGKQWWGTAIGAGVGAGTYAARRLRQRKEMQKKATVTSPKMALKASMQTAKHRTNLHGGKSLIEQNRKSFIGRKFVPPGGAT